MIWQTEIHTFLPSDLYKVRTDWAAGVHLSTAGRNVVTLSPPHYLLNTMEHVSEYYDFSVCVCVWGCSSTSLLVVLSALPVWYVLLLSNTHSSSTPPPTNEEMYCMSAFIIYENMEFMYRVSFIVLKHKRSYHTALFIQARCALYHLNRILFYFIILPNVGRYLYLNADSNMSGIWMIRIIFVY